VVISTLLCGAILSAHAGPPFPIVSNKTEGAYEISVWTDPDSTDDGSAAGRFWVTLRPAGGKSALPASTHVIVSLAPLDGAGATRTGSADPLAEDPAHRFVALVMDHEGRFRVRVAIDGPLGAAATEADVDATYDLRPAPYLIAVYLLPFVLIGFLWIKLMLRRRRPAKS
jgi:hypothetical protein